MCEKLLILLATPQGMIEGWDKRRAWGLTAGSVCDLLAMERIVLESASRTPLVHVISTTSTANRGLDRILARLSGQPPRRLNKMLRDSRMNPEPELVRTLVAHGKLEQGRPSFLGLFPTSYHVLDEATDRAIRIRLDRVLREGAGEWRDVGVLSILSSLGLATKVLPDETSGWSERRVAALVGELVDANPLGETLKAATRQLGSAMPAIGGAVA